MSSRYSTEFDQLEELGHAGFGHVFKCKNRLDEKEYAVKKIPVIANNKEKILREVLALSCMHHHHVVRYYQDGYTPDEQSGSEEDEPVQADETLYILMEFCPKTLQELLESVRESEDTIDKETVWRYFRQMVEGLHHIHEQSFIHRDLSRANIFFDKNMNIKIGDFGLAKFLKDRSSAIAVSEDASNKLYLAPEILEGSTGALVSKKADIFSLGLSLCDLLYQFGTDFERVKLFEDLKKGNFPHDWDSQDPILSELLTLTPSARPPADEILQKELPWKVARPEHVQNLETTVSSLKSELVDAKSQLVDAKSQIEILKKMMHRDTTKGDLG